MAALFTKYYIDSDFRNSVAVNERKFALDQLDWNTIAIQNLTLYKDILNGL